jgi:MFS family permease
MRTGTATGWMRGSVNRLIKPEYQHYLGSFLLQVSMVIGVTLIPFFTFQHLGGRERGAALAYGVTMLSLGVVCILSSPFVSALRNGLIFCLVGSIGFGVFYAAAMFATTVTVFCVLTGIAMVFFSLAWPAMQSWLGAQRDLKLRMKSFSSFNVAIGLGLVVGPYIAGVAYEVNYRLAFSMVFVTGVLAALLLFTLPREKHYFELPVAAEVAIGDGKGCERNDNSDEVYLYCGWLTNLLGWGLTGAVRTVYAWQVDRLVHGGKLVLFSKALPLHVFTAHSTPTAATLYSWMQSILSLGYFIAILAMSRTVRWQHRFGVIVACQALLGAGIWMLAGSGSLLVILICHAVLGAFAGFGYLGSQCYSSTNPQLKHRRIAMNEGLAHSVSFAIPVAYAQLGTWYGVTWAFRYTPLFLAAFLVLQLLSLKYAKQKLAAGVLSAQQIVC